MSPTETPPGTTKSPIKPISLKSATANLASRFTDSVYDLLGGISFVNYSSIGEKPTKPSLSSRLRSRAADAAERIYDALDYR